MSAARLERRGGGGTQFRGQNPLGRSVDRYLFHATLFVFRSHFQIRRRTIQPPTYLEEEKL